MSLVSQARQAVSHVQSTQGARSHAGMAEHPHYLVKRTLFEKPQCFRFLAKLSGQNSEQPTMALQPCLQRRLRAGLSRDIVLLQQGPQAAQYTGRVYVGTHHPPAARVTCTGIRGAPEETFEVFHHAGSARVLPRPVVLVQLQQ